MCMMVSYVIKGLCFSHLRAKLLHTLRLWWISSCTLPVNISRVYVLWPYQLAIKTIKLLCAVKQRMRYVVRYRDINSLGFAVLCFVVVTCRVVWYIQPYHPGLRLYECQRSNPERIKWWRIIIKRNKIRTLCFTNKHVIDCFFSTGWHRFASTLAQVMDFCLVALSHFLYQCWLIIIKVQWHSSESNFTRNNLPVTRYN